VLPLNKNLALRDVHAQYTVHPFSTSPATAPSSSHHHPPTFLLLFQASLPSTSAAEYHKQANISFD